MTLVYAIVCDGVEEWIFGEALKDYYEVKCFKDYRIFLDEIKVSKPDIIILDLNIELIQGEQLLIYLKHHRLYCDIPVIVVDKFFNEADYMRLLELGTDDYLVKPFKKMEVVFKVKKILRRDFIYSIKVGDIYINQNDRVVYVHDERVILTFKEFQLLTYICVRKNRVITRKELEHNIWKDYIIDSRTLDMHISSLRNKVFRKSLCRLITVVKIGYQIDEIT